MKRNELVVHGSSILNMSIKHCSNSSEATDRNVVHLLNVMRNMETGVCVCVCVCCVCVCVLCVCVCVCVCVVCVCGEGK